MIGRLLCVPIRLYQKYISPHLGNNCRFAPSCSSYCIAALTRHGAIKGGLLSLWRILRCNPFGKMGYDPVPLKGRWKNDDRQLHRE